MNDLRAQEYIEEIQKLKDQEIYQKKEIERLRNDNSTKKEQIDRNQVISKKKNESHSKF